MVILQHSRCYIHAGRQAKYPKWGPVFCTQKCAAEYGAEQTIGLVFCCIHRAWYDTRESSDCETCLRANDKCSALGAYPRRAPSGGA